MSKGFLCLIKCGYRIKQAFLKSIHPFFKKGACFLEKGCNLFSDMSSTDLPSLQSYILSNYQIVKPTSLRFRYFDTNHK